MSRFKPYMLVFPDNNGAAQAAVRQFADNVTRRTDGQIAVAPVPISKLVNQPALVRMVIDGRADMALPAHDRLSVCSKIFGCIGMPFVFDDHEHIERVLDGELSSWARADLESSGITYLGNWEWGWRQISNSRHPVLYPDDLRGLKIRVPTTPLCQATILALGAMPVMVEFEQLARVIRQRLVDGQENPVAVIYALKLQYSQRFLSMLNYSYGTLAHIINNRRFEDLVS